MSTHLKLIPIPKASRQLINHLYSLPYPQLLNFLAQQKSLNQLNQMNLKKQIFDLSMFHESRQLYFLSTLINSKMQLDTNFVLQQKGYLQIFQNQKKPVWYEKNLSQYYDFLSSVFLSKQIPPFELSLINNFCMKPSSILLNYFSASMDIYLRRRIKQTYIGMINFWNTTDSIRSETSNKTENYENYHLWRLFPPEIFNLADQSLVEGLMNNEVFVDKIPIGSRSSGNQPENIVKRLSDIQRSLVWMSRFNLGKDRVTRNKTLSALNIIQKSVKKLNQLINNTNSGTIFRGILIAVNSIYLISRKILKLRSHSCYKIQKPKQYLIVRQLMEQIISFLPEEYCNQSKFQHLIRSIQQTYQQQSKQLLNKQHHLFGKFKLSTINSQDNKTPYTKQILTKFIRLHILLVLFSETHQDEFYKAAKNFFSISSINKFLRQNITLGDISGQTMYAVMIGLQISQHQTDSIIKKNSDIWKSISAAQQDYNKIVKIMTDSELMKKQYLHTRLNNFQIFLSDAYAQNRNYTPKDDLKAKLDNVNKQDIIDSLLNDHEFMSQHLFASDLRNSLGSFMNNKDLRVLVKKQNTYPLFCDYTLKNNSQVSQVSLANIKKKNLQKVSAIWIQNKFCNKSRVVSSNCWNYFKKQSQNDQQTIKQSQNFTVNLQFSKECCQIINKAFSKHTK